MRRHFVFDVNETLSDMSPIGEVLERHGAPPGMASACFAGVLRDGFALSLHHRAPAFLDLYGDDLRNLLHGFDRLDRTPDEIVDKVLEVLSQLTVHADVVPALRALAGAGHSLTAFSDGSASATSGLLQRAGLLDLMTQVLSVSEGTVWKPHPEAYAAAATRLGTSPSDLTMVAVHPWDVDGAGSAGWHTVWLNRAGSAWPASFRPPEEQVSQLTDLSRS
jgi:2-haloacid dehalogenase